ncbi:MAG: MATE family efflux transporter [Candidatus Eisenbacteria bacterium]|nr:MATE family efflux transporter [Candidatus Eisenbacteria bacterium]
MAEHDHRRDDPARLDEGERPLDEAEPGGRRPGVDITEGNVLRNVLYMGVPSMIGFGAMTIYSLTDIFWVGRLGTAQVAALTMFGAIAWILGSTNQIVGTGSVALVSRRYGQREYEATRDVIRQTILLKFSLAAIMGLIGLILVPVVIGFMSDDAEVRRYAVEYGSIYFYGLPFMFTSYTVYTALRGVGDAPKAMYIMLMSTALNVGLDPLFIFGFRMGVPGAALATVISATCAVGVGLHVLSSGRTNITVPMLRRFHPRLAIMWQIIKIGIPAGINGLMRSVAHWYVTTLVATFGTLVVAAYGFSIRIMDLGILFGVGLELGASAIVGQNLGAHKKERAHEAVVKATLLVMVLTGALALIEFLFAEQILGVFTKDPAVVATGVPLVRLLVIAQVMIAMHIVLGSAFYGSGNTWPPTVIAGVIEWGVQIPLILLAINVFHTTERGVWWSMFAAASVEVLLTYAWFQRGHWKHKEV